MNEKEATMRKPVALIRFVLRISAAPLVFAIGLALFTSGQALAQAWPQKPIKVLIGFAAAGPPDIATRVIAPKLGEALGQPVVAENRPGAGGMIAMELVAKAAPDGYTLGLATVGTMLLAKALIPTAAYDPITSFVPVGTFAKTTFIVISSPSLPARNLKEFLDLARKQPGKLNYGGSTPGTPPHILAEMFKSQAGVDIFGINYKGSADAVTRFLAGDVQMMVDSYAILGPLIKSSKAIALLVTSPARSRNLPDVPTASEAGLPDFAVESWFGLVAPAGTPNAAVRRLNAELVKTAASKDIVDAIEKLGLETITSTPEEFGAMIKTDWPKWSAAVKASGAKAQ
jgi:tripartite-type tricarboxylate transporter receptor subunit TctC